MQEGLQWGQVLGEDLGGCGVLARWQGSHGPFSLSFSIPMNQKYLLKMVLGEDLGELVAGCWVLAGRQGSHGPFSLSFSIPLE